MEKLFLLEIKSRDKPVTVPSIFKFCSSEKKNEGRFKTCFVAIIFQKTNDNRKKH